MESRRDKCYFWRFHRQTMRQATPYMVSTKLVPLILGFQLIVFVKHMRLKRKWELMASSIQVFQYLSIRNFPSNLVYLIENKRLTSYWRGSCKFTCVDILFYGVMISFVHEELGTKGAIFSYFHIATFLIELNSDFKTNITANVKLYGLQTLHTYYFD